MVESQSSAFNICLIETCILHFNMKRYFMSWKGEGRGEVGGGEREINSKIF